MISYFGLSGKMNSSEPISRITPTVMGTYGLTLNFVGIRIPKNARYHSSGKEDGYQLFYIFLER